GARRNCASPVTPASVEKPICERRRPHEAAARVRASPRVAGYRFRSAVHEGQADHLRLSRLSMADSPVDIPTREPSEPARQGLQGRRYDYDTLRYGRAERSRSV